MSVTNLTNIKLCRVNWNSSNDHQVYFQNKEAQTNFFNNIEGYSMNNSTYQRENSRIRVDKNFEYILCYNYVCYKNPELNKMFFAFITKIEYENSNTSYVYIKTDVWQTWCFDIELKPSFVEREMSLTDNPGDNTVEENLEIGEYIYDRVDNLFGDNLKNLWYVVGYSLPPNSNEYVFGETYDGIYSGLKLIAFSNGAHLKAWLISLAMSNPEWIECITYIYSCPELCIPSGLGSGSEIPNGATAKGARSHYYGNVASIDGYFPKNKKLLTYPFNFLYISNNNGGACICRFEDFEDPENIEFLIASHIGADPTVGLFPLNFKGKGRDEERLLLKGYPLCSWSSDTFAYWFAQNKASIDTSNILGVGSSIVGYGAGMASMISALIAGTNPVTGAAAAIGSVIAGVTVVQGNINKVNQAELQPGQAKGNLNSGSLNVSHYLQDFSFYKKNIKAEYARIIDNYFSMFGYQTNRVKVPNVSGRKYWNYVKTSNMKITGNAPINEILELESLFNKGITFWTSNFHIGNYGLENDIL